MNLKALLKDRKVILGIVIVVAISIIIFIAGGKTKADAPAKDGYKTIVDVEGIKFDVDKNLSDMSTAVMEISERIDFIDYQTYSYKNGEDTYLLFNIQKFIVIAKKGTNFHFAETGVEKSFEENSLNGIWFSPTGKIPAVSSGSSPYTIDVEGQVVITNNIYNDFYGKLTTVTKDGTEWSLFVGVTEKAKETLGDMVACVTDSLAFYTRESVVVENYEVSVEDGSFAKVGEDNSSAEIPPEIPFPVEEEPDVPSTEEPSEPVVEETIPQEPNVEENVSEPAEPEEPVKEPTEPEEITEIVELPEETEPEVPEEVEEPAFPVEEPPQEIVTVEEETKFSIGNNQTVIAIDDSSAYTSSIYFMLGIGNIGYMDVFSEEMLSLEGAFIKPTRLIGAEEARSIIDAYCKSGESCYKSLEAPAGCHFEAIEYDVKYSTEKDYTNIRFCGLDGEALRYRGIAYSQMTYDILSDELTDGWYCGNICFYIVPNGCKEYALKCGSGTERNGGYNAYYRITVK